MASSRWKERHQIVCCMAMIRPTEGLYWKYFTIILQAFDSTQLDCFVRMDWFVFHWVHKPAFIKIIGNIWHKSINNRPIALDCLMNAFKSHLIITKYIVKLFITPVVRTGNAERSKWFDQHLNYVKQRSNYVNFDGRTCMRKICDINDGKIFTVYLVRNLLPTSKRCLKCTF